MLKISEKHFKHRSIYHKIELDANGNQISKETFDCRTYTLTDKEGKTKIFVCDRNGSIRLKPYQYLNDMRVNESIGIRKQIATALNYFYTFCDIFSYDPENAADKEIDKFINFLYGYENCAEPGSQVTYRSPDTIKGYLGMLHTFFETMEISPKAFRNSKLTKTYIETGGGRHPVMRECVYGNKLRSGNLNKQLAPEHFTCEDADKMATLMNEKDDKLMLCILTLGFCYGMRRGEILGLTEEDLVKEEDSYSLIIRNRISDKDWQHAKCLRHPTQEGHYANKGIIQSRSTIEIEENVYRAIKDYYDESRSLKNISATKREKILTRTKADSYNHGKDNHYLFDISGQTLNNHLKWYYEQCGLKLKNVSHAMRHSYAMAMTDDLGVALEPLRVMMRHACPESTMVYYQMTEEKKKVLQNAISKIMTQKVPSLQTK